MACLVDSKFSRQVSCKLLSLIGNWFGQLPERYCNFVQQCCNIDGKGTSGLAVILNVTNVTDWLNVNKLQSHPSKTKLMVIKQNLINKTGDLHTSIFMNNNLVSPVVSNKCLGVDLDHKLTFHTYIEEICKKICLGIGVLRRIRQFIPQGSLVTLYNSLIQPYFDYCSPLWDTCDKTLRNKLQILQNHAARVIMGTRYDDRIRSSDLLQSLGWDTLHVRWAKLKSVLLYKILNENYSPCLRDMFVRLRDLNRQYNL